MNTLPALVLGAGGTPPIAAADAAVAIPAADSAANFLGSGAGYDMVLDIGDKLAVAYIGKSMKKGDHFGVNSDGTYKKHCTSKDLQNFAGSIDRKVRPNLPTRYPGGTFIDYLLDLDYDPQVIVGHSYYPSPGETWTAYTCTNQASVDRFEQRKRVLRMHVADLLVEFSEREHWMPMLSTVTDQTDGQAMLLKYTSHFYEDSLTGLAARAATLRYRSNNIVGAEDPSAKITEVVQGWSQLQMTAAGAANFPVS